MHPTILCAQEAKIGRQDAREPILGAGGRTFATLLTRPPLGLPALAGHHANLMPGVKGVAAWFGPTLVERCEVDLPAPFSAALPRHDDDGGQCRVLTLFVRGPLLVIVVVVYQRQLRPPLLAWLLPTHTLPRLSLRPYIQQTVGTRSRP